MTLFSISECCSAPCVSAAI